MQVHRFFLYITKKLSSVIIIFIFGIEIACTSNRISQSDYAKAEQIHQILIKYIQLEDEIILKSYTELVDFGSYGSQLSRLHKELAQIVKDIRPDSELHNLMIRYGKALCEAIELLHNICQKLDKMSEGHLFSYPYGEYQADIELYKSKVKRYQKIGKELSEYMYGKR